MPLVYRPAREQDLERAQELVVRSINDLTERHGFGPMAVLRPTQFQSFSLKDETHVALKVSLDLAFWSVMAS